MYISVGMVAPPNYEKERALSILWHKRQKPFVQVEIEAVMLRF